MSAKYSITDYLTKPLVAKLDTKEALIRDEIMESIINTHEPFSLSSYPQRAMVEAMADKNILTITDNKVTAIYPVSALPTNKTVQLADGRFAWAMCAIDALGFHYTFNQDITIESACQHCHEHIVLSMHEGKVEIIKGKDSIHVLHTDLENLENWSCCCCSIMHFFDCADSLDAWVSDNNISAKTFSLDLEEANKIAWLLFSR